MGVSKVEYNRNGTLETLIDVSSDTASEDTVLSGYTFTKSNGEKGTGTVTVPTKTSDLTNDSGFIATTDLDEEPTENSDNPAKSGGIWSWVKDLLNGFLPLSGGKTVTGQFIQKNLTLDDGVNTRTVVTAYDDGDSANYGSEVVISGGGNMFIGGGESAVNVRNAGVSNATSENMHVSADGTVYVLANCNTIANRKTSSFNTDGTLTLAAAPAQTDDSLKAATTGYVKDCVPKSVGSATQPVYSNANGVITKCTYTLGASVPSDAVFTDTTYNVMSGASSSVAGSSGLVPAPASGQQGRYLRGDGTWQTPTNTSPGASGTATFATAKGTNPSGNQYHEHISYDNSGNGNGNAYRFARVTRYLNTSGQTGAELYVYDATSGATRGAALGIYYPKGGTAFTQAPTPAQTDDSTKIATTAYVKDCVPKTVGDANTPVYTNANGVITACSRMTKADNGSLAVGSYVIANLCTASGTNVNNGATTAGTNLRVNNSSTTTISAGSSTGTKLSGTWRNVSGIKIAGVSNGSYRIGLWQRVS